MCRELSSGSYFGEQALLRTDLRTASVTARTAVDCLALDRESFFQLVGDLQELKEKVYSDTAGRGKDSREFNPQPSEECQVGVSPLKTCLALVVVCSSVSYYSSL